MNKLNIEVEHIFHSGFTIETESYFLVFDYYKGEISLKDKKTIVFVSHSHGDHFNPEILQWENKDEILYIFSSDIKIDNNNKNIHMMNPYDELKLEGVTIQTFGSTDLGVSFHVNVDDINIFHSGDLYWWHWEEDSIDDRKNEEKIFKDEISKIKGNEIDIAFFPVDPRLGEAYSLGGEYFIKELNPKYFFPMHFGDNFNITKEFINKMKGSMCKIIELEKKNQIISL